MLRKTSRVAAVLILCLHTKGAVFATNAAPVVGSVSPSSGTVPSNTWTTFTCTYSDADGFANLWTVRLLVNNVVSSAGGAYFFYSQNTNKLYMNNNSGAQIGGITLGTAGTIESENAVIDTGATTVSSSGNTITVNWRVKFKSTMNGKNCNTYLKADDDSGATSGWVDKGDVSIKSGAVISAVYCVPTSLTLLAGTTYSFARAHAVDPNGQVVSSATSFDWSSQDTSVVSIANAGLTPDGRHCKCTISALNPGQTTVTVTAGGESCQIPIKVVANPTTTAARFLAIPVDQAPGLNDVPITQNGYRYAYFYAEPGKEYRFRFERVEGYEDIWISYDPMFVDSTKLIDVGYPDWGYEVDVVTPNGYGAYYVRMKGESPVNLIDVTISNGSWPRAYSLSGVWSKVEPNGQVVYDSVGKNDIDYYYFPVKANTTYRVEVAGFKGYNYVWIDDATDWKTPIFSGYNDDSELQTSVVARANGYYYIAVRGEGLSNFYRLRICTEDTTVGGYQVHGTPGSIVLPAGTSRTIFADCIAPNGTVATSTTSFQWASDNPSAVSVIPGGLTPSGYFRQATIEAPPIVSQPVDTTVRVSANGVSDRIAVRVIDLSQLYGNAVQQIQPDAAFPTQVSLGKDDWVVYWYQVDPGTEYSLTVTSMAGSVDVEVYSDPMLFDEIAEGSSSYWWDDYTHQFVAASHCGTHFVLVRGSGSSNVASIQLTTVAPTVSNEVYYPRGTIKSLVANADPYNTRTSSEERLPDIYTFVTDTEFARYTVTVSKGSYSDYVDVYVADNMLGMDSLAGGDTYWDPFSYSFLADTIGKRYYVLVYGKKPSNHYSISLTKQ